MHCRDQAYSAGSLHPSVPLLIVCFIVAGCTGSPRVNEGEMPLPGIWLEHQTRGALPAGIEWRSMGPRGLELTKVSEAFRGEPYDDPVGFCTVGYGHLIKKQRCDGTEPLEFRPQISELTATELLRKDMRIAEYPVMTAVLPDVLTRLTETQFDALCDFVFNVGAANFRQSQLLEAVNALEYHRVPGQLRRWVYAKKIKLPGLVTRREREIELFMLGVAATRGPIPADEELSPIDIHCEGSASGACSTVPGARL